MATSISDILADAFTERAVQLLQLTASMQKSLLGALKDLEDDLVAKLVKIDVTGVNAVSYQQKRLEALLKQTRQLIDDAYKKKISTGLDGDLRGIAEEESKFVLAAINKAVGVDLATVALSPESIREIAKATLIEGAASSKWWAQQAQRLQNRFANEIRQGMLAGESVGQLIQRIRGTKARGFKDGLIRGLLRRQAEALVRTSVQAVANAAYEAMYRVNDDIVKALQWVSTLDSRTCFSGDTSVLMAWGERKPIEHICPGEKVVSGSGKPRRVLSKKISLSLDWCLIILAAGDQIECTSTHPFWVFRPRTGTWGWVEAGNIADEDKIGVLVPKGSLFGSYEERLKNEFRSKFGSNHAVEPKPTCGLAVAHVARFRGKALCYDLEIANDHSYLVGSPGLIAHNTVLCIARSGKKYTLDTPPRPIGHSLPWGGGPGKIHWNSVIKGTKIAFTKSGASIPVEHIAPGARVMTHRGRMRRVLEVHVKAYDGSAVYSVQVGDGRRIKDCLLVSEGHPLLRLGQDQNKPRKRKVWEWREIERLKTGDTLLTLNGNGEFEAREVTVAKPPVNFSPASFYDLSVEEDESYVANGFVVHNCRSTSIPILRSWQELSRRDAIRTGTEKSGGRPTSISRFFARRARELGVSEERIKEAREMMDGEGAEDLGFQAWLTKREKSQPGFATKLLGVGKADLWRKKVITLEELLDFRGQPLTLEELKQRA